MPYHQITSAERYTLGRLHGQGWCPAAIARVLDRDRSTIGRELHRNGVPLERDAYHPPQADAAAQRRRSRARRPTRFTPVDWACIAALVRADWSPEQIAGRLRRDRRLVISAVTIYRYIWQDQRAGGHLYTHLRGASKQRRKRYGAPDSRGRLAGKRPITARPAGAAHRSRFGHWEGDTMLGAGHGGPCVLTLVERKSGYVAVGQLAHQASVDVNRRARQLIAAQPRPVRTITVDNGGEFHGYAALERVVDARVYFATPHHAWERGSNENANGLLRQYLPKGASMAHLTQDACNRIATQLNRRPRKRLHYRTPEESYVP